MISMLLGCWSFVSGSERQSPSLDDLEKNLQNVNAMLQSAPPKQVSFIIFVYYEFFAYVTKCIIS